MDTIWTARNAKNRVLKPAETGNRAKNSSRQLQWYQIGAILEEFSEVE